MAAELVNRDLQDLKFINEKYLYLSLTKENQPVFSAVLLRPSYLIQRGFSK